MHVQLADNITQCGDIHFIGTEHLFQHSRQGCRLTPHQLLIMVIQLK